MHFLKRKSSVQNPMRKKQRMNFCLCVECGKMTEPLMNSYRIFIQAGNQQPGRRMSFEISLGYKYVYLFSQR